MPSRAHDFLVPSALLSSRWSRDNYLSPDPGALYTGVIREHLDTEALGPLLAELVSRRGSFEVLSGALGVLTWNIRCQSDTGPFLLQLPVALDGAGVGGRARSLAARASYSNASDYLQRGLGRYVLPPEQLISFEGGVQGATFSWPIDHVTVSFRLGSVRLDVAEGDEAWVIPLGPEGTASLLVEMLAALVYHYDPDVDGGTALGDVFINDGDFLVRRRADGKFSLRLCAARRREKGIDRDRFLFYLLQLVAYEDWTVDSRLVGLPVLVGNPSLAFEGLKRGLCYRYTDLGLTESEAIRDAIQWLRHFASSALGRGYQPWVRSFLEGKLPPTVGDDPRFRWWNLTELRERRDLASLRALHDPSDEADSWLQALSALVERLADEIGRRPLATTELVFANDLDGQGVSELLGDCASDDSAITESHKESIVRQWMDAWPYRSVSQLPLPASIASPLLPRLTCGAVVASENEGTLESLDAGEQASRPSRFLANPEVHGPVRIARSLLESAVRRFPTFQDFMDEALHDPVWGYYSERVEIGQKGDFSTHPESLSPHYGRWIASCAIRVWREMIEQGELRSDDPFVLVEFGAGNGRLARDVVDAVRQQAQKSSAKDPWAAFLRRLDYRIYERSASLRIRQKELLGGDGKVLEGDARQPGATLRRDFPNGLKGLVLSNELPDAFGVQKVVLDPQGKALAVLVIPRVEERLLGEGLSTALCQDVRAADDRLRDEFGWARHDSDRFIDRDVYGRLMAAIFSGDEALRNARLDRVWFEEALVPASCLPALRNSLAANATELNSALLEQDSGVVTYVNLHAQSYVRELAQELEAGFIVTIDYGNSTCGLIRDARLGYFPFRVYRDEGRYVPKPNHPYIRPGTQDMTADVNFTDLARAGMEAGLCVNHFGPERDIVGEEFPLVLASADQRAFAKLLGNSVFKMLVLGTRETRIFSGPSTQRLPLFAHEPATRESSR